MDTQATKLRKILAYTVHLFTATGSIFAVFSLSYIGQHKWHNAYLLLVIALIIDSVDGLLARHIQVKRVLPEIDGNLLDNIIDFLVWAIIPAYIVWEADLLPLGLDFPVISLICLASAYQFCRSDAKSNMDKTEGCSGASADDSSEARKLDSRGLDLPSEITTEDQDYFFRGFPSAWILLVYFLVFSDTSKLFNTVILSVCGLLSFVPIKCIYPTRTKMWKKVNIITTGVWLAALLLTLLLTFFERRQLPKWFLLLSIAYAAYYVVSSACLTWKLGFLERSKKSSVF